MTNGRHYFVYVLKSHVDRDRYIGLSTDIEGRLKQHNSKKVFSTSPRTPFECVYHEMYGSLREARVREKYFKSAAGRRWLDKSGF